MMDRNRAAHLAAFLGLLLASSGRGEEQQKQLSKDDERLLVSLLKDVLFEPTGAERVVVRVNTPGWRGATVEEAREGWLVRSKVGDRVYFIDGESVAAPPKDSIEKVDFFARCRRTYSEEPKGTGTARNFFERKPHCMTGEEPTLVLAAWLYRLGDNDLAVRVLAHAPEDRKAELAVLRKWLAQTALNRMMQCFGQYEDETALEHGERLLRLYPAEARELAQAEPLTHDLQRREIQGVMGKKGSWELPKAFSTWDRQKRLTYLIDALDATDRMANDNRLSPVVNGLMEIGEAAIPALLDVLDNDDRMTRCVWCIGKYELFGQVLTVRETALAVVCRILRVRQLDTRNAEAEDGGVDMRDFKKAANAARAYWKEFGPLPYEARMMRVLNDRRSSFPALREAATILADPVGPNKSTWPTRVKDNEPNPIVQKFSRPTAAEAVLSAMDRDLAHDDTLDKKLVDHFRADHEPCYFYALIRLGDRRIAAELARRAAMETNPLMRMRFAHASHRLGQSQAIRDFAGEFTAGRIPLPTDDNRLRWQLEHIIEILTAAKLSEAEDALFKLAEPGHRYHEATMKAIVDRLVVYDTAGDFLSHPYCVRILQKMLDDTADTSMSIEVVEKGERVQRNGGGFTSWSALPAILTDPHNRKTSSKIRRCDLAAEKCSVVAGLPSYHPLLMDAENRQKAIKKALAGFPGKYRALTSAERLAVAGNEYAVWFGPDISALGRPATAVDVKAGKAIFHLAGKGTVAKLKLPARGTWKAAGQQEELRHCLIVQAEVRANGETVYGVVGRHTLRTVPASELSDIMPLKLD